MKSRLTACSLALSVWFGSVARAADLTVTVDAPVGPADVSLASAGLCVDPAAAPVVHLAAGLLADDLGRVTGRPSAVGSDPARATVLIGTLGDGGPVDDLVKAGKVDATGVRGQWETFAWQVVDDPSPGVRRAMVVVGSDRRGTAYGCTELSKAIGVSPWTWWADVPTPHHADVSASPGRHVDGPPGVKYRGIFLNDEEWGFYPWASKTFDPQLGNVGPKTYAKVYEVMLRLRLNYLWPAMHPGTAEFGAVPGNAEVADRWAVVMGASHCEPMLRNNVYWNKAEGPWRYDTNRDNILRYWTESVDARGQFEADWTLGIRGIHDSPMSGPKGTPARVKMVDGIFADQEHLINAKVTDKYGPPARCFVPYKEVLPLYDAGLRVPDEATLVWPDDNFGYIRHLPTAAERRRPGGNGVYYHVSYRGGPQSYLWVETTSPGLIWEELHKAWQNDAGRLWVNNVGDLKPAEVTTEFYADLAWAPDRWGPDAQDRFLHEFFAGAFGPTLAGPLADLQASYYRLAAVRRPEQFTYDWLHSLSAGDLADLGRRYVALQEQERSTAALVPADRSDVYFEMVGYAARVLAATGQLYLHDEAALQPGHPADLAAAKRFRQSIADETRRYNEQTAGGKWRGMMSDTPKDVTWPTDVGGQHKPRPLPATRPADPTMTVIDAADTSTREPAAGVAWQSVAGLGRSGRAITPLPATSFEGAGPTVEYTFTLPADADAAPIRLHLLPTMRLDPAGHLRLAVGLDGAPPIPVAVPGGESGDENSGPRRVAVLTDRVTIELPATLGSGRHTLTIRAVDPGVVLDQIELPSGSGVGGR